MHKNELVKEIASQTGHSQKTVNEILSGFQTVVTQTLATGESVIMTGFGSFSVTERAERAGRNPVTGEALTIAAHKAVRFKAGQLLRDNVQ